MSNGNDQRPSLLSTSTPRSSRRRRLPSLGALATFEVAAKHLSFTLAAEELHITQAAVSQQIRGLEKQLECQLFLRHHNRMELTNDGRVLLESVVQGLDRLGEGVARIRDGDASEIVTIASTYAGISQFLKPMVDAYRAVSPHTRFTLLASDGNDRLRDFEEVDFAIICGNERAQVGADLIYLFPEVVDPVCSPDYLARHGPFTEPGDLLDMDLMELHRMHWSSDAIAWYPLTWSDWFRHFVPESAAPEPSFVTNCYATLARAAIEGQGVALGWRHLVMHDVEHGRLLRLFDRPFNAGRSYYLKINPSAREKRAVADFIDHFRAEISRNPQLLD